MGYERKRIAEMHGYVPGKQPTDVLVQKVQKQNTNENPYPPCPAVMDAMRGVAADALRRYPPPAADAFRERAAALHGVTSDQVVAVNGGDELLRMVLTTFVEPGAPIGIVEPSYSLYPVLAEIHGSPIARADAREDFGLPAGLAEQMNRAGAALLFVVNPHAPSGHLTRAAEIEALAGSFKGVLVLDEAYVDFVDPALSHDCVSAIARHDNLLILRTLSKGYSLAGLRFGYGLGAASLIAPLLWKTRDSYNTDVIAQAVAEAALAHGAEAARTWQLVRQERSRVTHELSQLGFRVPPSQSNFVLAFVPSGQSAPALRDALERAGILVRHFDADRVRDALRITIGTPEQNTRLLEALRACLG